MTIEAVNYYDSFRVTSDEIGDRIVHALKDWTIFEKEFYNLVCNTKWEQEHWKQSNVIFVFLEYKMNH